MAKTTNKKKAEVIYQLFQRADNGHRRKWRSSSQKCSDFYHNDQLTKAEQTSLENSGMPTFTINRITPVIEMMKYFATAKSPRWQAVGAEGSDSDVAAVHSDIADFCWYHSNGNSLYSHVIQDALIKGVGYFQVDVDPDMDKGLGEVVFKRVEPNDVWVDPMSRDFLFRDASYIIIKKDLPKTQLINLFPQFKKKIQAADGSSSTGNQFFSQKPGFDSDSIQPDDIGNQAYDPATSEEDQIVDCYEFYSKEKYKLYNLFIQLPPDTKDLKQLENDINEELELMKQELSVQMKESIRKIDMLVAQGEMIPERAALEKDKEQDKLEDQLAQHRAGLMAKLKEVSTKIENQVVTEPEYKILIKNELFRESIVEAVPFYDTRIKISVSLGSETILYETYIPMSDYPIVPVPYMWTGTPYPMSAVLPLIGKQQEINKAHQLMIHNANLASNLRWIYEEGSVPENEWEQYSSAPGALLKYRSGFTPPTPVQPSPINQAFYATVQEGKQDMEYISGIYSSMQGDLGSQHDTYRGLLAQDEHGTRRIKAWMQDIVEPSLEHLGKLFQVMAQNTYQAHKIFQIVQPSAIQDDRQVEINIPIYNDFGQAIEKFHDYSSARFDVRIIAGSTLPVNRWALLEEYFRWYQSGLIDDVAMLAETDVRGKEQILKRKSIYSQMKSQIDSMEGALKDRDGTIETLSRQLVQSGIKDKTRSGSEEMVAEKLESKAQHKLLRERMKDQAKIKPNEKK